MYVPKCTVEHHHIRASDSLELGLQMAVNCAVGAGSQTWVFCKNSQCF